MAARKPIAVDDYVRQWGQKVIRNTFSVDDEDNLRKGGDNLYFLLKKIVMDEGTKADLEIPLRVLRDMILEVWKDTKNNDRYRHTYMLISMYDKVFERVLGSIQEASQSNDESRLRQEKMIMDELRSRLHKCVTGETWKDYPALRMVALRQVFTYKKESAKIADLLAKTSNGSGVRVAEPIQIKGGWFGGKKREDDSNSFGFSWEDTLDACVSASSDKLFPLLKILLTNGKAGTITMEGIVGINLAAATANDSSTVPVVQNGSAQAAAPAGPATEAGAGTGGPSSLIDLDFMAKKQKEEEEEAKKAEEKEAEEAVEEENKKSGSQLNIQATEIETEFSEEVAETPPPTPVTQNKEEPKQDPFTDLAWEKFG